MRRQGSGHIVFVSSLAGRFPGPGHPSCAAGKAGPNVFADPVMLDLRSKGIKVTLIERAEVDTPMQGDEDRGRDKFLHASDVADAIVFSLTRPARVCISDIALLRSDRH